MDESGTETSSVERNGQALLGPVLTVVAVAVLQSLAETPFQIPIPSAVLCLIVIYAAFVGGLVSSLTSAAIACLYLAYFFSIPGAPFQYEGDNLRRMLIWTVTIPSVAVIVGRMKARLLAAITRQLSAQQEADAKLRAEEQRTRSFLNSAYDAFVGMNAEGNIIEWNKQAEATFGWTYAEALGQSLAEILIPQRYRNDHQQGLKHFLETAEGPILNRRLELSALHKSGYELPIELTVTAAVQGHGQVFGAFLHDISDRKRGERHQLLQLSVTRILYEADTASTAIDKVLEVVCQQLGWHFGALWMLDASKARVGLTNCWHEASPAMAEFEAASRVLKLMRGQGLPGRVFEQNRPAWIVDTVGDPNFPRSTFAAKADLHGAFAFPVWSGDEVIGVIEFLSQSFRKPDESLLNLMADIGIRFGMFLQKKEAEKASRLSEERYRYLVATVKDYAIIMLDADGRITSWNAGAESIKGYLADEIIGKHFSVFYPKEAVETRFPDHELETARAAGRCEDEGLRVRKDGTKFYANVVITALYDIDGKVYGFSKVTRDITERKQAEEHQRQLHAELERRVEERTEELTRAKEAAEAASRAKTAFLANMSHEIRTPLGAVMGFSELIPNPSLSASERVNFVAAIKRNGELLSNIISDILDLSKVEAGKLAVEKVDTSIPELITDISSLLNLQALEKGLKLTVTTEGVIPEAIYTDPLRLRQILINLLGNAIKFTQKGSVEVVIKQTVGSHGEPTIAFIVKDSGHGISPEQGRRIFEPFTQADPSMTRRFGGSGLGLPLARRLAQLLGGDVELTESSVGGGSTFTVTIDPGGLGKVIFEGTTAKPALRVVAAEPRLDGLRVLLVEDAPDNRMLVGRILRLSGAEVEVAADGQEAVEKALTSCYDVLLMDLQMPVMDGYEATAELRKKGYSKPIIALTAHALREERTKCLSSGFDDHLSKPVDREVLLARLATYKIGRAEVHN